MALLAQNVVNDSTAEGIVNVAFGKVSKGDLLGGINEVKVTDLLKKDYHAYSLDGISEMIGGYNGNIWGQSPLILVDGVPRCLRSGCNGGRDRDRTQGCISRCPLRITRKPRRGAHHDEAR